LVRHRTELAGTRIRARGPSCAALPPATSLRAVHTRERGTLRSAVGWLGLVRRGSPVYISPAAGRCGDRHHRHRWHTRAPVSMNRQSIKRLVAALAHEAHRAQSELKASGHRRPYFVSYLVRDIEQFWIDARFG